MRKLSEFFLLAAFAAACSEPLFDTVPHSVRHDGRPGVETPSAEKHAEEPEEPEGPTVYATALSFPAWAAWKDGDQRSPRVILFRNGQQVMSVPSSADPERHRYREDHLWTDRSDGEETVLYRDGEVFFRFPGEELFRGFSARGDTVHTLGQRQGREGFSYRMNGEELFSSPVGTLLGSPYDREWEGGAFSEDLCYSYGIPVWQGDQLQWEYRVMRGSHTEKIVPADASRTVFDIRHYRGVTYRSELRSGGMLSLVADETLRQVSTGGEPHLCKLVPLHGEMFIKGYSGSQPAEYWIRGPGGVVASETSAYRFYDLYTDGEEKYAVSLTSDGLVRSIWTAQGNLDIPPGTYRLATPLCCDFREGVFAAALSNAVSDEHILVAGSRRDTVCFNGYFTSLQIR